jgi:hypothetical protein
MATLLRTGMKQRLSSFFGEPDTRQGAVRPVRWLIIAAAGQTAPGHAFKERSLAA